MKIAIPLFGKRVAPHFGTAPELLVVLVEGQKVCSRWRAPFSSFSLSEKKKTLFSLGIDALVCGGIDRATRGWLERRGVRVCADTIGDAMEALSCLLGDVEQHPDK
jgi:predicted Fe-Mo cluster-binding NifX family protein